MDIAVEKHFYGKGPDSSLDKDITVFESEYAPFLESLREMGDQSEVSDPKVNDLVVHLSIRNRWIREELRQDVDYLLDVIKDHLSDYQNLERFIFKDPQAILRAIDSNPDASLLAPSQKKYLKRHSHALAGLALKSNRTEFMAFANFLSVTLQRALPSLIRNAHIDALSKGLAPAPRVEFLSTFNWYVLHSQTELILGDTACLSESPGTVAYRPFLNCNEEITAILLPIASTRLLLGCRSTAPLVLDFANLNGKVAECSSSYFISSSESTDLATVSKVIGERSAIFSKDELDELAREVLEGR